MLIFEILSSQSTWSFWSQHWMLWLRYIPQYIKLSDLKSDGGKIKNIYFRRKNVMTLPDFKASVFSSSWASFPIHTNTYRLKKINHMNCFSNSQCAYERENKGWTEHRTEQKHIPPGVPGSLAHLNKVSGRWQEAFWLQFICCKF